MARLIKVSRLSSMVEGIPCAIMIDDSVKYHPVHEKGNRKYIKLKSKRYYEDDLPIGKEIWI